MSNNTTTLETCTTDLTQRLGRIVRQGNTNKKVHIYRYVTEETFDAYLYQIVEKKQKFISQIMTSKTPVRSAEDIDETALSYGEIKALASGNPLIKEKTELDAEVARLKLLKQNFLNQRYALEDSVNIKIPTEIKNKEKNVANISEDMKIYSESKERYGDEFPTITLKGNVYYDKEAAGKALLDEIKVIASQEPVTIGSYRNFELSAFFNTFTNKHNLVIRKNHYYTIEVGSDNFTRIENALQNLERRKEENERVLPVLKEELENGKRELSKEFKFEDELKTKQQRLDEVNATLNISDKAENVIEFEDDEIGDNDKSKDRER